MSQKTSKSIIALAQEVFYQSLDLHNNGGNTMGLWHSTPVKEFSDSELNGCIQEKAKKLWKKKGCVQGKDLDIWLEAEKSVKSGKSKA